MSTRRCARMTKLLRCISYEVCNLSYYDGLGDINNFLEDYEEQVPECQRLLAMDIALRDTLVRWWGTHKKNIRTWKEFRRLIWVGFA